MGPTGLKKAWIPNSSSLSCLAPLYSLSPCWTSLHSQHSYSLCSIENPGQSDRPLSQHNQPALGKIAIPQHHIENQAHHASYGTVLLPPIKALMLTLTPRLILHNGHEIAPISQVTRGTTTSFLAFNAIVEIKDLLVIAPKF